MLNEQVIQSLYLRTDDDPVLRQISSPVVVFDQNLKKLTQKMIEIMKEHKGIGLAAPQIGVSSRIIIVFNHTLHREEVLINPSIIEKHEPISSSEGCLSLPEQKCVVPRFNKVVVEYQDIFRQTYRREKNGLDAICIQHEIDHLNGVLMSDYTQK